MDTNTSTSTLTEPLVMTTSFKVLVKSSSNRLGREVSRITVPRRQFWLIITALLIAYFLSALDQTIVIVALPSITGEFGQLNLFGYVVSLYLITSASVGPIFGKLSDMYGRRKLFLIALIVFMGGSILCGASVNMFMLVASRALQGIGGGGLSMLNQIMFADIMTPAERAEFASMTSLMIAVASVVGPLVGGIFCQLGQWRWIFYINIPFVVVSFVLTLKYVNYEVDKVTASLDFGGAALSITSVSVLLLSFGVAGGFFWEHPISLVLLVLGFVGIFLFFLCEAKVKSPIIPLYLFKIRNVNISNVAMATSNLAQLTMLTLLTLYFQVVRYDDAQVAGLWLLPMLFSLVICATLTGRFVAKTNIYRPFLVLGNVVTAAGTGMALLLHSDSDWWVWVVSMVLVGLGYGFVAPVVKVISQNSVEKKDIAAVTVTTIFFRTLGGAFGTGLYGALFLIFLRQNVINSFGNDDGGYEDMSPDDLRNNLSPSELSTYLDNYSDAIAKTLFWITPVMVISALPGFGAQQVQLRKRKVKPLPEQQSVN